MARRSFSLLALLINQMIVTDEHSTIWDPISVRSIRCSIRNVMVSLVLHNVQDLVSLDASLQANYHPLQMKAIFPR